MPAEWMMPRNWKVTVIGEGETVLATYMINDTPKVQAEEAAEIDIASNWNGARFIVEKQES